MDTKHGTTVDLMNINHIFFQTTVVKKKIYYNMRVKTLQRNKADLLFRLETEKAMLQAEPKNRIQKLYSAVKDVRIPHILLLLISDNLISYKII